MKNHPKTTIAIGTAVGLAIVGTVGFACYKSNKGKADGEPKEEEQKNEQKKQQKGSESEAVVVNEVAKKSAAKEQKNGQKKQQKTAKEQAAKAAVVVYKAVQEQGADEVAKVVVSVLKNEEDKTQQGRMVGQNRDKVRNAMGHK